MIRVDNAMTSSPQIIGEATGVRSAQKLGNWQYLQMENKSGVSFFKIKKD